MTSEVDADYLVVGAGAAGMAFCDALVDHDPDARVLLVDRRDGVGGHWRGAYPFVRLHQASCFYGVASTPLGGGRIQQKGPEKGLHERADQPTILAYYDEVLARLRSTGRVELRTGYEYAGGRSVAPVDPRAVGERLEVPERCRVVDARYLAPEIPSETPPRFEVGAGARVVSVNDVARTEDGPRDEPRDEPSQYVVVGSGKTATDACVHLLGRGVDPDAICWVRPREPWMLNRAMIQPDPAVYLAMVADLMAAAGSADTLDDLFLRLEDAGVMLRIDRAMVPTMAKAPTLGTWELDLLRSIENVVRLGHVRAVGRGRIDLTGGSVAIADDALVVNCAADGLRAAPLVPLWRPEAITLQPIRAGFPCFGAALAGYVEATRDDDDEKNRLCPPSSFGNSLADWARMNVRGMRNAAVYGAEPDIRAWAAEVALNPGRVPAAYVGSPALEAVQERLAADTQRGLAGLARLAGVPD